MNKKLKLAQILEASRINRAGLALQSRFLSPYVRAVNYHDVPRSHADAFEAQLRFYQKHYQPVGLDDLAEHLDGRWQSEKPGLILSFDDGMRSHYDVVMPLLERYGFTGWFMVPGGFVEQSAGDQVDYATEHSVKVSCEYDDFRVAMNWDEVRYLATHHVVGCHTWNHTRLGRSIPQGVLHEEIIQAKALLEANLVQPISVFCWVGGEESSYSQSAASCIEAAGFRFGFMTNSSVIRPGSDPLQLDRTNVEARDPRAVQAFQVSGLADLWYTPKRTRVRKLTKSVA